MLEGQAKRVERCEFLVALAEIPACGQRIIWLARSRRPSALVRWSVASIRLATIIPIGIKVLFAGGIEVAQGLIS